MATAAQQMFAISPAFGEASLTGEQKHLLVGKARWIYAVAQAGQPTLPTICITRTAWQALKTEHEGDDVKLRTAWVATLFRLVGRNQEPPPLVVRTSAPRHTRGLMRARIGISAPVTPEDSVSPKHALVKGIDAAFESYATTEPVWAGVREQVRREQQIVIIQAMAEEQSVEFTSRDRQSGTLKPVVAKGYASIDLPSNALAIAEAIDDAMGTHAICLVENRSGRGIFVSARPVLASAAAELAAAVDRVETGAWSPREAVNHIDPARLPQLLHPTLASSNHKNSIASGIGVSPGAASGEIVFTAEDASRVKARGKHCILVALETGPADTDGMQAATGILTARGGQNSHAAIIARVSGKPCVASVRAMQVDPAEMTCRIGDVVLKSGQKITIDGSDGKIYLGELPLSQPNISGAISKLLNWSDGSRTIAIRTNVETIESASTALEFGAEGIGLARSEHMFFSPDRLMALRRMILSESETDRRTALKGLVDYQLGDYAALFEIMSGKPVNVRLFDPPLHEFLPRTEEDIDELAAALGLKGSSLHQRLERLVEVNPMLGHRGCRLTITYPEILEMQVHALFAGAKAAAYKTGVPVDLEIMVPFVTSYREVNWLRGAIGAIAKQQNSSENAGVNYKFGTMIELPRAALRAGDIAPLVDFFSFGTNDLTQTTYGVSRDDAPAFLATYKRMGLYDEDPFTTIDQRGVGEIMKIAIQRGRAANPDLTIGVCGEHAGDPVSVKFFAGLGVDYISCSPYRVPVARLAMAQAQQT